MMMKSVFWWRKPEYPEETTVYICVYVADVRRDELSLSYPIEEPWPLSEVVIGNQDKRGQVNPE